MGNRYRNVKTNEVITLYGNDAVRAVGSGEYAPADEGGGVPIVTEGGKYGTASPELVRSGTTQFAGQDQEQTRALGEEAQQGRLYNSPEHKIQAAGEGILRGMPGVNLAWAAGSALAGYDQGNVVVEHNPGAAAVGGLVGVAGSLGVPALGAGVGALAAEGALYGGLQATADLVITNPDITAESFSSIDEALAILKSMAAGGAVGGTAGLVGKGFGAVGNKLKGRRESIEAATAKVDAMNAAERAVYDAKVAEIEKYNATAPLEARAKNADDFARVTRENADNAAQAALAKDTAYKKYAEMQGKKAALIPDLDPATTAQAETDFVGGLNEMEAAAVRMAESHQIPFSAADAIKSDRLTRQLEAEYMDTGLVESLTSRSDKLKVKRLQKELFDGRKELEDLWGNKGYFNRDSSLDAGGAAKLQADPERLVASSKPLDKIRKAASEIHRMSFEANGLSGGGWTKAAKLTQESAPLADRLSLAETTIADLSEASHLGQDVIAKADGLFERALSAKNEKAAAKAADDLEAYLKSLDIGYTPPVGKPSFTFGTDEETAALRALDPHDRIAEAAQRGRKYVKNAAAPELEAAITEINAGSAEINKLLELPRGSAYSPDTLRKLILSKPDKAIKAFRALDEHVARLEKFAAKFDDGANGTSFRDAIAKLDSSLALINQNRGNIKAADIMQQLGILDPTMAMAMGGRADELTKAYLARKVAQDGALPKIPADFTFREFKPKAIPDERALPKTGPKEYTLKGFGPDKSPIIDVLEGSLKGSGRRLGNLAAHEVVPARGPLGALVGGAMTFMGGHVMGTVADTIVGLGSRISGQTNYKVGRIAKAVEKLAFGAKKAMRVAAPTTLNVLNSLDFSHNDSEAGRKGKTTQEAMKHRMEELATTAADPDAAQLRLHKRLEPLRQALPMVADRLEVQEIGDQLFLYEKMPKDDGGMTRWGKSRWQPSDDQVAQFAAYARAKQDPAAVVERAVGGRITPQEAEFLRVRRPEMFAQLQKYLAMNLQQIQENATIDQCTRMSILLDVPVDPFCSKQVSSFMQQRFAEQAASDQKPVDLNADAFQSNQPTDTQALQGR